MSNFKVNLFGHSWTVMYTKPNCEKKFGKFLDEQNIEYFLPLKETLNKWHDRHKLIMTPIFPSYVFVRAKNQQEFYLSLSSSFSLYYLKENKQVSLIAPEVIESLKIATLVQSNFDVTDRCKEGKKVLIRGGVFNGLIGELVMVRGKKKVQVTIKAINRSVLVTTDIEFISAI